MKICYYTWKELDEGKNKVVEKRCSEKIWKNSKNYCIFHYPSFEKDINLFKKRLKERLKKNNYIFHKFYFPAGWSFKNIEFGKNANFNQASFKNADFREAIFLEDANFKETVFEGYTNFEGATFRNANFNKTKFKGDVDFCGTNFNTASFIEILFNESHFNGAIFKKNAYFSGNFKKNAHFCGTTFHEDVYFDNTTFHEDVYFDNTTFHEDVYFRKAIFLEDANFKETVFEGYTNFEGATFRNANFRRTDFKGDTDFCEIVIKQNIEFNTHDVEKINFQNSKFYSRGNITTDFTKAKFNQIFMGNITFYNCKWPKKIFEEVHMREECLTHEEVETIYRTLKQSLQRDGNYIKAGDFYYREMECKRKAMRINWFSLDWFKSFGYSFLKYTCGYGEKPYRVICISFLVIVIAALFFAYNGISIGEYTTKEYINYDVSLSVPGLDSLYDYSQCLYYSFVTFTTLGTNDMYAVGLSKIIACAESFLGAFFMALFVVVFVRKLAR